MELFASIRRNSLGLGIFAVLTAGLIAITHQLTDHTIKDNILSAQISAFNEILPADLYDNDLTKDIALLPVNPLLGSQEGIKIHIARKNGDVVTTAI